MAASAARSTPGSLSVSPRETLTYTSELSVRIREYLESAARSKSSFPFGMPRHERFGYQNFVETVNASISHRMGRVPSIVTPIAAPTTSAERFSTNSRPGFLRSRSHCGVIANKPVSSVGPKRFLKTRSMRYDEPSVHSRNKTVSTKCSSTFGPEIEPSFVTCPISTTEVQEDLQYSSSISATARICVIDQQEDAISVEYAKLTESITTKPYWPCFKSEMIDSISPVVTRRMDSFAAPSRWARSLTWDMLSSALTYKTGKSGDAIQSATCNESVDFPIPGSPESSTKLPRTSQPPKTVLSSSLRNTDLPLPLSEPLVAEVKPTGCVAVGIRVPAARFDGRSSGTSTKLPHSLQVGHLPCHLVLVAEQAEQRNI